MEVTRKNFKESISLIEASIAKADFLVIDAEFTGLISGRELSVFDTPKEYYNALLTGSSDFLLIQFGLCAFYWDDSKKQYMNDAYNFYLFPRGRPGPDKIFLCHSASLDFLASQGFDFNKLIKEGISYMTEPVESKLRESLTERHNRTLSEKSEISIPYENKQQIEDICRRVRKFLDTEDSEEMEIDRCNAFIRRLLFQELAVRFKDEAFVESKVLENKERVIKVTKIKSASDVKSKDILKKEKEWEDLEEAVGFSKVARMISQSGKLVIGHNMVLDVLHTLNHFFQPLPSDYESFKEFAHCMFPRLLDTKYMSSLPPFKDKVNSSVLSHLLQTLSEPPFTLPKATSQAGRGYEYAEAKQHEAGYDAYITGLCFLAMHAHVLRMRGERPARVAADSPLLKPFTNRLFLAKTASQDSPYINLVGLDPMPPRDHVFHLTFPREWQRNDLNQLFSAFGQITIQFIDDTTALVALHRKEMAKTVLRSFSMNSRVTLVPYAKYKMLVAKKANRPPQTDRREDKGERPKKICSPNDTSMTRRGSVSDACVASPSSRVRSNSFSLVTETSRKRTASGLFQVDDEPAAKKKELQDSKKDSGAPHTSNGASKSDNKEGRDTGTDKDNKTDEDKVIDTFGTDSKVTCVNTFKESYDWD